MARPGGRSARGAMTAARQSLNRMARRKATETREASRAAKSKAAEVPAPSPKPWRHGPKRRKPAATRATSIPAAGTGVEVEHTARSPLSLKPAPRPEPPPRPASVDQLEGRCSATDEEADLTACYQNRELAICRKCRRTFCENCLPQHQQHRCV